MQGKEYCKENKGEEEEKKKNRQESLILVHFMSCPVHIHTAQHTATPCWVLTRSYD
jgi:hypothetical protein